MTDTGNGLEAFNDDEDIKDSLIEASKKNPSHFVSSGAYAVRYVRTKDEIQVFKLTEVEDDD